MKFIARYPRGKVYHCRALIFETIICDNNEIPMWGNAMKFDIEILILCICAVIKPHI